MKWNDLVTSPPPDTVWHIDANMVLVARRERRVDCRCFATDTPPEAFSVGPVGLQSVDSEPLNSVVKTLQAQGAGSKRPALIVPTAWVRSFLLELEELPRKQGEIEDVLRWRLKKLLPVPVKDLRLVFAVQPKRGDHFQVLCGAIVERAASELEQVFSAAGMTLSLLVPRITALAMRPGDAAKPRLVIQQEAGFISMVLLLDGGLRLIRTKPLPMTEGAWAAARQEIGMTMTFLRSHFEVRGPIETLVCAMDEEAQAPILEWLNEYDEVNAGQSKSDVEWSDSAVAGIVGESRLSPVSAVLLGGMP